MNKSLIYLNVTKVNLHNILKMLEICELINIDI